jgi:carotenoid cleavage dioxygenase
MHVYLNKLFTYYFHFIRKQRYVYGTTLDSIAKVTGIIKFDLHAKPDLGKAKLEVGGNVQGLYDLGPGRFGSEAVFVPRVPGTDSKEDDGYLIFFVHDENTGYHFPLNTSSNELYEIKRFLLSV